MLYSFDFSTIVDFFKLTTLKANDIAEIVLIILLAYQLLKHLKGTRVWTIAKGVLILFLLYGFAYIASFNVITYLAGFLVTFLAIALVIMFQPELRKLLENLGRHEIDVIKIINIVRKKEKTENIYTTKSIEELIKSVNTMSKAKTGALILIERDNSLADYESSGIKINADISNQLIINIFEKNTPLHDGAMIIRNNKISAATCYLPLSDNRKIDKSLGTRHRAAIGASEQTDALVIVVSEETGAISIAVNGKIKHGISAEKLHQILKDNQVKGINLKEEQEKIPYRKTKLTILSIIFGTLLWFILTDAVDPIVTVNFNDIPVQIINDDSITDTGYLYEIKDGESVDIIVKGHRSQVGMLKKEDFVAIADAEYISVSNSINIDVKSNKYNDNIEIDTNNAMTTIVLEEAISIECKITAEKTGKEAIGYCVTKLEPTVKTITITGPKSKLNTIEKAVATIDVNERSVDFEHESYFDVYDKNGNIVDLSDCKLNTQRIKVLGTVSETKEVPIKINIIDSELENCTISIKSIESSKDTVLISASNENLASLNEIEIDIDIAGNNNKKINLIVDLNNYLPKDVYLADSNEVTVNFTADRIITEVLEFSSALINCDSLKDVTFKDDTYEVEISYLLENKSYAKISELKPQIKISTLQTGTHKVDIIFSEIPEITILKAPKASIVIE